MLPKFIQKKIDGFRLAEIMGWLKLIIVFFIKPKRFYRIYFSQSKSKQIDQFIFYIIICPLILLSFFTDFGFNKLLNNIFLIIFIALPFIGVNYTSWMIIEKTSASLWKTSSFVILSFLFILLPSAILMRLFLINENYSFLLLRNIVSAAGIFFFVFFFWHTVFISVRKILLGYLLNFIILNLIYFFICLILIDSYSRFVSDDPIISELVVNLDEIKDIDGNVHSKIETTDFLNNKTVKSISVMKGDSLYYYGASSIKFIKELSHRNIKVIDSIVVRLNFKRNKELFKIYKEHFEELNSTVDSGPCDTCFIRHTVISMENDNKKLFERHEYRVFDFNSSKLKIFHERLDDTFNKSNYAQFPNIVPGLLFLPSGMVLKKFFHRKDAYFIFYLG